MEKSGFFGSVAGDRKDRSINWAEYFSSFVGNGVFPLPTVGLQVVAGDGMSVVVKAGKAWINGYYYCNTDDLIIPLTNADGVLRRIDRIVLRWDLTGRLISGRAKSSTFASTPVAPALQRNADAYELCLGDVMINNGATGINQSNITDQRYNTSLCGIVTALIQQIDFTTITAQFEAFFSVFKEMLGEETAGDLLLLVIEAINETAKPNLTIDGAFSFWYEGTSQTTNGYGSDTMWRNEHIGATKTHSRQTVADNERSQLPGATYYSRTVISAAGSAAGNMVKKSQRVEDVTRITGKHTFSFYAKADAAKWIAVDYHQNFGTGGSPPVTFGTEKIALTTGWKRYDVTVDVPSVNGKVIGANDYFVCNIWFSAGSDYDSRTDNLGNQTGTFDIALVKFEQGSIATPFVQNTDFEALRLLKYIRPIYDAQDRRNAIARITLSFAYLVELQLVPEMRIPPSLIYVGTNSQYGRLLSWNSAVSRNITNPADITLLAPQKNIAQFSVNISPALSDTERTNGTWSFHWQRQPYLDARL